MAADGCLAVISQPAPVRPRTPRSLTISPWRRGRPDRDRGASGRHRRQVQPVLWIEEDLTNGSVRRRIGSERGN